MAGNELRLLRLCWWLIGQGYDVHVAWKGATSEVLRAQENMPEVCFHVLSPERGLGSLRSSVPILHPYESKICPDWLINQVEKLDTLLQPDVFISEYVFMSRCLVRSHAPFKIIDTHDVFSRRKDLVEKHGISESYYIPEAIEKKLLARANILMAIQEEEARCLRRLSPSSHVVTCGVDFKVEPLSPRAFKGRSYSALIVASDNPANRSGIDSFLKNCWPLIKKNAPKARLAIVGGVGNALADLPAGVSTLGLVEDLKPVYAASQLALNPVIAGTGLKIKSVEALAHRLPLISFANGAEGLPPSGKGRTYFIAENWSDFADQALLWLQDPRRLKAFRGEAARLTPRELHPKSVYADLQRALPPPKVSQAPSRPLFAEK